MLQYIAGLAQAWFWIVGAILITLIAGSWILEDLRGTLRKYLGIK